jgi:N-hydroxyarylamine O-acetyltransferase
MPSISIRCKSADAVVIGIHISLSPLTTVGDVDGKLVSEYLGRIGVARPASTDAAALRELHRAHLMAVPFENLSIHLDEPISLADSDLFDKIVTRRRGGFCYELNGTFALLLEALGFDVTRLAARVYGGGGLGPPFDHLALAVSPADGSGPWLADVGFGSHSTYPLLLDRREEQDDPAGRFQIVPAPDDDLDVLKDSEPQYRLESRARLLEDFVPTCWWQQTAPESHFRMNVICSRLTEDGRISIGGRTLIRTSGGVRTERELVSDDELLAAYREHFGIALDRLPEVVQPSLAR